MRTRRNKREKNNIKYNKKVIVISCIVFLIILFFSVIFSLVNINNTKILSRIEIQGINVSNLTKQEAKEKLENWYKEVILKNVTLKYQEMEEIISPEELDIQLNFDELIQEAINIGKTGNILKDNYDILFTFLFKKKLNGSIIFNEEKLDKKIEEISNKLPVAVVQSNYYIEDNNLIIKKGTSGITIKKNELKEQIKNILEKQNREIVIPVENTEPEKIDIEKIYKEIYKEPENAYVESEPLKVHTHINGVDFAITMEEAKQVLQEDKEEYTIPLKITIPEITLDKLGTEVFPNELAEFTTRYDASNKNRSINLELASNKINGTIVLPGETFSYNKIVGQRTIAAGYKEATVYSGGKIVQGIGGGICQLSSTLYNAVLYANLEVTSRTNHRFLTSYVKAGRDATVSWGTIDFCFKNTRKYPIKIVSTVKNGIVRVGIYGIKEEVEYEVVIETTVLETIPQTTNYIKDNKMAEGESVIEQYGSEGAKSVTYKILKLDGAVVSKTVLSNDTYSSLERIERIGTNKVNKTSTLPEEKETQIENTIEID